MQFLSLCIWLRYNDILPIKCFLISCYLILNKRLTEINKILFKRGIAKIKLIIINDIINIETTVAGIYINEIKERRY